MRRGQKHEPLFVRAKAATGKEPATLITNALPSYRFEAGLNFPHAAHIREIAFAGGVHNNKMGR